MKASVAWAVMGIVVDLFHPEKSGTFFASSLICAVLALNFKDKS